MGKHPRWSGLALVSAGVLGALFFWLSDPRYGWGLRSGATENVIDAANEALVGTFVGIAGSVVVLLIGLWLLSRRAV